MKCVTPAPRYTCHQRRPKRFTAAFYMREHRNKIIQTCQVHGDGAEALSDARYSVRTSLKAQKVRTTMYSDFVHQQQPAEIALLPVSRELHSDIFLPPHGDTPTPCSLGIPSGAATISMRAPRLAHHAPRRRTPLVVRTSHRHRHRFDT